MAQTHAVPANEKPQSIAEAQDPAPARGAALARIRVFPARMPMSLIDSSDPGAAPADGPLPLTSRRQGHVPSVSFHTRPLTVLD